MENGYVVRWKGGLEYINRLEPKSSRIKVRACKLGCKAVEGDKAYKEENVVEGEVAEVF